LVFYSKFLLEPLVLLLDIFRGSLCRYLIEELLEMSKEGAKLLHYHEDVMSRDLLIEAIVKESLQETSVAVYSAIVLCCI
jgi:biotin synthase-related radical SAM superfamily protein